jgi:polynucleotide 5'-hydroxyl-kinase GRC3/NOL9
VTDKEYEWEEICSEFAEKGKIALLLGDVDTGKTTFIKNITNYLLSKGLKVCIIDADIGQSSIGPPSTIGFALVESKLINMEDLPVKGLYFVGAISPVKHLLPCIIGLKQLLEQALSLSVDKIIIDTTGMVRDNAGIALKQGKIELIKPDFILAFSRGKELEPVLSPFKYLFPCSIKRIKINSNAARKSPEFRALERKRKFLSYFNKSRKITVNLLTTGFSGLNYSPGGTVLPGNELRWLSSTTNFPVTYAEKNGEKLVIAFSHLCDLKGINEMKNHYAVSDIDIIDPVMSPAGLIGEHNKCLAIGIITDFRPKNASLELLSPFTGAVKDIKRISVGTYRLPEDLYNDITSGAL